MGGRVHLTKEMREFVPVLRRNGFSYARSKGSHFVFVNRQSGRHISVNKDLNEMVRERLTKENALI